MKIILFHLEILEVRRPKYKKEKALIQQGFPKIKSPFFDKNVRKTDFVQLIKRKFSRLSDFLNGVVTIPNTFTFLEF